LPEKDSSPFSRLKIPAGFSTAYPDCPVTLINRENMMEFVG